jgi:branched-chain amino acid transport system substrate-binding protein
MKNVLGQSAFKAVLCMLAVLVMTIGGLSACAQNQLTNSQMPITIGISLSFSGDFKDDGLAMKQGYQLWADTVNYNGGLLGRPVQLIILDDKSAPDQVAKNYTTLIHTDHVDLVFGPFSSLLTKAAAPVVQSAG